MEVGKFDFEGLVNKSYKKIRKPQNLNCILFEERRDHIILRAHKPLTNIEHPLLINKKKKKIKRGSEERILQLGRVINQKLFSGFLGIFKFDNISFMLFAEYVLLIDFINEIDVFEIFNVAAISMNSFQFNKEVTDMCNAIMKQGFYFSYQKDLTQDIYSNSITINKIEAPQWLFFINRKMTEPYSQEKTMEWVTPLILGTLTQSEVYLLDYKKHAVVYILSRVSIPDILNLKTSDLFYEMLSSSNSIMKISIALECSGLSSTINFFIATIPATRDFSAKRAYTFYQFYKLFFNVNSYLMCTDDVDLQFYANMMKNQRAFKLLDLKDVNTVAKFKRPYLFEWLSERSDSSFSIDKSASTTILFGVRDCFEFYNENMAYIASVFTHLSAQLFFEDKPIQLKYNSLTITAVEHDIIHKIPLLKRIKRFLDNIHNIAEEETTQPVGLFSNIMSNFRRLTQSNENIVKDLIKRDRNNLLISLLGFNNKFLYSLMNVQKQVEHQALSHKQVEMCIITHNCAGFMPDSLENKSLVKYGERIDVKEADILVICLQEIMLMKPENFTSFITENNTIAKNAWQNFLIELFEATHNVFFVESLLGLMTIMFIRTECVDKIKIKVTKSDLMRIGLFNFANKAFIINKLIINDDAFDIINCHMSSGTTDYEYDKRAGDLRKAYQAIKNNNEAAAAFIIGDLNFRNRMEVSRVKHLIGIYKTETSAEKRQTILEELLKFDELGWLLRAEHLSILNEFPIRFIPSYKFFVKSDEYDFYEGKRIPSWTDRVLYIIKDNITLDIKQYTLDEKTRISDHKPVIFLCSLKLTDYSKLLP